jgi:HAE1 family hydrophobic/amphiphilic exporter-1
MEEVLSRMRRETAFIPGIKVSFSPVQNLKVGASTSSSTYQYTLQSVGSEQLDSWAARLLEELDKSDVFEGLDTDYETSGLEAEIALDRDKMALLGVDNEALRTTLHSAFGGREVSTIYAPQASYKVIMELSDDNRRDENDLSRIYVRSGAGGMVPLSAFARVSRGSGTMTVLHKAQLPAITLSFELAEGKSLSDATTAIEAAKQAIALPSTVFGSFDGQAALFQESQTTQIWLIIIAIAVIYVILGVLYASWIHPVTILMGIPSAALGAFLALRLTGLEISFIAMIGVLLLVGIVKKNAIMMIDFALAAQRTDDAAPGDAIRQACLLRFRPIMMTTLCAMMGALPIALGLGTGAELRQPLGVVIVGGLVFSQVITLFLTPVLYLWFDELASGWKRRSRRHAAAPQADLG